MVIKTYYGLCNRLQVIFSYNQLALKQNKNNDYVLNVPYTPKLNPIESYFSQLKHYIKLDSAIEYKDLKKSVKRAFKKIKKENYKNYFYNSLDKSKLP